MSQEKKEEEHFLILRTAYIQEFMEWKNLQKKDKERLITATSRNIGDKRINDKIRKSIKQKSEEERTLSEKLGKQSMIWTGHGLKSGNFNRETEYLLIPAQNNTHLCQGKN